jgi:hypothetical protein
MLVAQNRVEELRLITHDLVLERYGLSAEGLPSIFVLKGGPPKASPGGQRNENPKSLNLEHGTLNF